MGSERRNRWLLLVLIAGLGLAVYQVWPDTAVGRRAASEVPGSTGTRDGRPAAPAPDVHLESLKQERPKPGDVDRTLFRFKSKPVPAPAPAPAPPVVRPGAPVTPGGPAPPLVPPIPLKFIGILEVPGQSRRVAVLSDPRGVYPGREGDIIEGRYRILKIGTESIELAYVDGRGRQTLRLSGQ